MKTDGFFAHAPAKMNLFFDVLRRLNSEYHEIESLVTGISLFDSLYVRPRPNTPASSRPEEDSVRLTIHIPHGKRFQNLFARMEIPCDERNLVMRAARLLQKIAAEKFPKSPYLPCADIILTKRIPAQAGLGGGSSDAAATLLALNRLWNLSLSRDELVAAGASLGCDIPLFFTPLPVICRGRGEILENIPRHETLPRLDFVLLCPPVGLSTARVYQACTPRESCTETLRNLEPASGNQNMTHLLETWRKNDLAGISRHLFNRLQPAAKSLSPWISEIESAFRNLADPCVGFSMTGSGSAFFGLCRDGKHAKNVAELLKRQKIGEVFTVYSVAA